MALPNKNFFGIIEGRNIYSFLADLDYDIKTSAERVEHLKKVLSDETGRIHPFFERLFEQTYDDKTKLNTSYIKLILNSTDGLYSDTNVCEVLTKLTDYLLFAEDMRALERAQKQEYKIYKDEVLFRRMMRELSLEAELEKAGGEDDGEKDIDSLIHIMVKDKNFRKDAQQVIYAKDFEDIEVGEILKAYQHQIDFMNDKLVSNKDRLPLLEAIIDSKEDEADIGFKIMLETAGVNSKEEAQRIKIELVRENKSLVKHIGLMKCDMLDAKDLIKRPIRFKHLMSGSTKADLSKIEFIPKQKEDAVPWLRERAKELEEYYSDILDELEHSKTKGEQVLTKIHKYNALYIEAQHMQTMSDDEIYEEKYLRGIKDVIKQLILQPDKESYDFQNELELEVYLAKEILQEIKMDELDRLIISLTQQGWSQKEVAFLLNRDFTDVIERCTRERKTSDGEAEVDETGGYAQSSISRRLDLIAERIMEFVEKELDNYLDAFRPADKVKVCSKCGRTLSRDKFDKEKLGQYGLKSKCKECRKGE